MGVETVIKRNLVVDNVLENNPPRSYSVLENVSDYPLIKAM